MNILGLNFSIDASAALVREGQVIAASEEERFVRSKHYAGFPHQSIQYCLNAGNVEFSELDAVAFFWNPGIHAEAGVRRFTSNPRHHLEFLHNVPANLLGYLDGDDVVDTKQVFSLASGKELTVHYITHHMCHAASAFYTSPFDDAAILTVDGYGERQSTVVAKGSGVEIEPVLSVDFPHSLGSLYAAFTEYLGFRANSGEGKVMGLASYGKPGTFEAQLRNMVRLTDSGFELDLTFFEYFHDRPHRYNKRLVELLGPERKPESELDQRHMDIAYGLQKVTEEVLLHLASLARKKTGSSRLCLAGGVGLNCVANGRMVREAGFEDFFFYPAAGDAGTAIGAGLWVSHVVGGEPRSGIVASEYLGPSYTSAEVQNALDKYGVAYRRTDETVKLAAKMIADGLIIGWFQGRGEFGPRALGNRSILADPRRADMKDLLNSRVKFRESFRPYAPSVLETACGDYFSSSVPSPYMLCAYDTLPDKVGVLPAITHVDGTARVQTVTEQQNPRYYRLIHAIGERTGVPVVLNTSFNIRGEPIVNTVQDALKCFFTTDLDALFVEDHLVMKDASKAESYFN
ncbi:MAG: carbamoyltransferase [Proteobacteria bacterium]|nr:carbamoyltransferase [Pseudomonadota bacterium]